MKKTICALLAFSSIASATVAFSAPKIIYKEQDIQQLNEVVQAMKVLPTIKKGELSSIELWESFDMKTQLKLLNKERQGPVANAAVAVAAAAVVVEAAKLAYDMYKNRVLPGDEFLDPQVILHDLVYEKNLGKLTIRPGLTINPGLFDLGRLPITSLDKLHGVGLGGLKGPAILNP